MFCLWLGLLVRVFRSRRSLLLENLALRPQLTALKRKHPKPKFRVLDKLFWVVAIRFWSGWKTVSRPGHPGNRGSLHRTGSRLYWSFISRARKRVRRKKPSKEVRDLIFRMIAENPRWGAPHPEHMRGRQQDAGLFRFAQPWLGCSWYGERDSDPTHQRTGRSKIASILTTKSRGKHLER
jgi:hypothetical protein